MQHSFLTLGKIAKRFGLNRETLRYYERVGLIKSLKRTPAGYRLYDETAEKTLSFILKAKNLGFTLEEIKALLALRVVNTDNCKLVRQQAQEKIKDIEAKIAHLGALKKSLEKLVSICMKKQTSTYCPILDNLEN